MSVSWTRPEYTKYPLQSTDTAQVGGLEDKSKDGGVGQAFRPVTRVAAIYHS